MAPSGGDSESRDPHACALSLSHSLSFSLSLSLSHTHTHTHTHTHEHTYTLPAPGLRSDPAPREPHQELVRHPGLTPDFRHPPEPLAGEISRVVQDGGAPRSVGALELASPLRRSPLPFALGPHGVVVEENIHRRNGFFSGPSTQPPSRTAPRPPKPDPSDPVSQEACDGGPHPSPG